MNVTMLHHRVMQMLHVIILMDLTCAHVLQDLMVMERTALVLILFQPSLRIFYDYLKISKIIHSYCDLPHLETM